MASLVHSDTHIEINTEDHTTMGYCVVKYMPGTFILKDKITLDRQVSKVVNIYVQTEYLTNMKEKSNWYWEHK